MSKLKKIVVRLTNDGGFYCHICKPDENNDMYEYIDSDIFVEIIRRFFSIAKSKNDFPSVITIPEGVFHKKRIVFFGSSSKFEYVELTREEYNVLTEKMTDSGWMTVIKNGLNKFFTKIRSW